MLPNFLVVGAMRCATGWIRQCLTEHPEIFMARLETHFFDRNFDKGLEWWEKTYFIGHEGEKAVGEKTATYLHDPEVPRRIAETLPDVKLICCLRDPLGRSYSHYLMWARNRSVHSTPSFMEAATEESDLIQRSLYFKQIKWFLEEFPRENMLVKIYEDKFDDPVGFVQDIYSFLRVDTTFNPPSALLQTKPGSFENQNKFWYSASRLFLHPRAPLFLKKGYNKVRPETGGLRLGEGALKELAPFFKSDISCLEGLLNRDLRCWKSKSSVDL
jgi:hypothetical protein